MPTYLEQLDAFVGPGLGVGVNLNGLGWAIVQQWLRAGQNGFGGLAGNTLSLGVAKPKLAPPVHCAIVSLPGAPPVVRLTSMELDLTLAPHLEPFRPMERFSFTIGSVDLAFTTDPGRGDRVFLDLVQLGSAECRSTGRTADFARLLKVSGLTEAQYQAFVGELLLAAVRESFLRSLFAQATHIEMRPQLRGIRAVGVPRLAGIGTFLWMAFQGELVPSELHPTCRPMFLHSPPSSEPEPTPPGKADEFAAGCAHAVYAHRDLLLQAIRLQVPSTLHEIDLRPTLEGLGAGALSMTTRAEVLSVRPLHGDLRYEYMALEVAFRIRATGSIQWSTFDLCSERSPAPSRLDFDSGPQTVIVKQTELELAQKEERWYFQWAPATMTMTPDEPAYKVGQAKQAIGEWLQGLPRRVAAAALLPWADFASMPDHGPSIETCTVASPAGMLVIRG